MRSLIRTLGREQARDVGLVCLADALVGASFGAIAVGAGLPLWMPVALSVVVFAGASQFMLVGIIASGGALAPAVGAGLLVNARHLPFGFSVADLVSGGVARRLTGSHLMVDESVAFALAQRDPARRRAVYWASGVSLFVCWNLAVLIGALAGRIVEDTDALGLDAAFPAVLLALVLPSLRDPATRSAALIGAAVALATSFVLPAGLPVLLSLAGLLALLRRPDGAAPAPGSTAPPDAGPDHDHHDHDHDHDHHRGPRQAPA